MRLGPGPRAAAAAAPARPELALDKELRNVLDLSILIKECDMHYWYAVETVYRGRDAHDQAVTVRVWRYMTRRSREAACGENRTGVGDWFDFCRAASGSEMVRRATRIAKVGGWQRLPGGVREYVVVR